MMEDSHVTPEIYETCYCMMPRRGNCTGNIDHQAFLSPPSAPLCGIHVTLEKKHLRQ